MIANGSPYGQHTSPDGPMCWSRPGVHALLAWLSTRVLRGGPRLLLQVAACILGIYLLSTTLPQRAADVTLGSGYSSLWKWAGTRTGGGSAVDDGSVGGGLRVVVFGASDMATIPDEDDATAETTWAEAMCTELDCSTYISLAPKAPSRALSSNTLYASVALPKSNGTDPERSTPPGLDYSFYPEVFPVPSNVPDFSQQVTDFLSRPRPKLLPRETLWVFNFGHWDVWNMAALPLKTSRPVVEAMVNDVILNIERLYSASMDDKSIAHSDFLLYNSTAAGKAAKAAAGGKPTAAAGDAQPAAAAEVQTGAKNEPEEKEMFRIVVPMIFDQTLAPGWRTERPNVPAPHSKAEQQRNAATLTELWNAKMQMAVMEWAKKENPKPGNEAPAAADATEGDRKERRDAPRPLSRRTDEETKDGDAQPNTADAPSFRMISRRAGKEQQQQQQTPPPPPKVYPLRDAIIYDLQEYMTEIMVERQLRNVQYVDQNGLGGKPESQGFRDVATPCVQRAAAIKAPPPPPPPPPPSSPPSMRTTKRGESGSNNKPAAGEVCDNPRERLFYMALTLSPRAVNEIGREIAELVVENHTLREYWDSVEENSASRH
ncbi:hypothetical protein MAPG_06134 [Magnaporthiopsis poae ATCC 64411]|uniref:Uncharacterized protein n=1 Tax=Magnaporthiopsis poae (strain ATCC 64411 / 73-15) TaxID=644358 RepID=A0A0C4E181_MAGP6|nr:hypothetical protein MAPG_06134 [Magnaporthiopsis poae ATCC 64411]